MSQDGKTPLEQHKRMEQHQSQGGAANQGEGNREAAAEFNRAEREFVESPRGQQKIREGTHVSPSEEPELSEAERRAAERARAQDSNHM